MKDILIYIILIMALLIWILRIPTHLISLYKNIRFEFEVWKLNRDMNAPYDDICCCGDSMTYHDHPMNCGHTPISQKDYAIMGLHDKIYRKVT